MVFIYFANKVFKEIRDVTVEILKKTTLAELIKIEKELMNKK